MRAPRGQPRFALRISYLLLLLLGVSCGSGGAPEQRLAAAESTFLRLLDTRDQIDVTRFRGVQENLEGRRLDRLREDYSAALEEAQRKLSEVPVNRLDAEQTRVLESLERRLASFPDQAPEVQSEDAGSPECEPTGRLLADAGDDLDRLLERVYACFGRKARQLQLNGETLDRLTILGRLAEEPDPDDRRALFYALEPLWVSTHPASPDSPYRRIIELSARRRRQAGASIESAAALLGIAPEQTEPWLVSILEAWQARFAGRTIEPWDYYFMAGEAGRTVAAALPLSALKPLNDRFYRELGADPGILGIHYDLEPRFGKDPVAFTTFGLRNRRVDDSWRGSFWVFATYREGGLGNLAELLHETGHGVHLAAIRTRPAFQGWPDSDIFTEAVADLAAWDIYLPDHQRRLMGTSAPLDVSLRARYSAVMLDVCWALFEIYLHRSPELEPNQVWTDITSRYLGIRPHPEIAWWAIRGQLVSLPGYMLNYALGAILVADLRQEVRRRLRGRPRFEWYPVVSEGLFRYGLEQPAAEVIQDFLGRNPHLEPLVQSLEGG